MRTKNGNNPMKQKKLKTFNLKKSSQNHQWWKNFLPRNRLQLETNSLWTKMMLSNLKICTWHLKTFNRLKISIVRWQQIHNKLLTVLNRLIHNLITLIQKHLKSQLKNIQQCGRQSNIRMKNSDKIWIWLQIELPRTIYQIRRCLSPSVHLNTITGLPTLVNIQTHWTEEEFLLIQSFHLADMG